MTPEETLIRFGKPAVVVLLGFTCLLLIPGLVPVGPIAAASPVLFATCIALAIRLAHAGRVDAAVNLVLVATTLITTLTTALIGGIGGALTSTLLLIPVLAGVLRGLEASARAFVVSGAAMTLLFLLELFGVEPRLVQHISPMGGWLSGMLTLLLTVVGLNLYGHAMRASQARVESARRALDERLESAKRLESLGQLAGGVAHDFRNLLTAIQGSTDLILEQSDLPPSVRDDLQRVVDATNQAAGLTQRLLAFAARQEVTPLLVDPSEVARDAHRLGERMVGEGVSVRLDLQEARGLVLVDPGQLQGALVNLISNAKDALPRGGQITLRTRLHDLEAGEVPNVEPGTWWQITVEDDGEGMDANTLAKAVDPFFTTKPVGKGTGLGLATVHGLASSAGGHLHIDSALGAGTRVSLFLPVVASPAVRPPLRPALPMAAQIGTTILLVDDQEMVRETGRRMLEAGGYRVLEAESGEAALAIAERHTFDVLVTDVRMPGMSGTELATALEGVPVVFVTGYSHQELHGELPKGPTFATLRKPFRTRELLDAVADVNPIGVKRASG